MKARALVAFSVVTAFALGWAASDLGGGSVAAKRATPVAAAHRPDRRSVSAAGERGRTERGARAAAISYATASQDWLYLGDEDIDRSVRAIATATAGPSLSRDTVGELSAARDALAKSPGRVWWLVRPLASHVERFDPASARVVVWTVTILSAADVALPQADWSRVAVDLVWASGGWRVQAIADSAGPTPMTGTKDRPWEPEALDEALVGFERVASEEQH